MKIIEQYLKNYTGTNYEIGVKIGEWVLTDERISQKLGIVSASFSKQKYLKIKTLLDEFCPGVNAEIQGFADTMQLAPEQILFYAMII